MSDPGSFDAVLLLGFGGPEGPDDVLPFLRNVTAGRGVPDERLAEVAQQYELFGGVSPINGQNRALLAALAAELEARGREVSTWWGNRNWHPLLPDTVAAMRDAGVVRALALATSAWSSYSACRQYLDDISGARTAVGDGAPEIIKVRPFFNHPGFIEAQADRLATTVGDAGVDPASPTVRLVFTAHSIPESMASTSDYGRQLREAAGLVVERACPGRPWDLVFQSRSGPPHVPWLGPDVVDHLGNLPSEGVDTVVVVPLGFISDHMEVLYDLDTQAAAAAAELGLGFIRVPTVGTHPRFVAGLVDLLDEHLVGATASALGTLGPRVSPCAPGCCPAPSRPR